MKKSRIPAPIVGFEDLALRWYENWQCYGVKINQGEYCVTNQRIVISTVLGSCISVCAYDETTGFGGMNHFMLPQISVDSDVEKPLRYGLFSMEQLINKLLKNGSKKEDLCIKVIGGGRMMDYLSDIGQKNINFIMQYIKDEQLNLITTDLGGEQGRKLAFFPSTGRLLVSRIAQIEVDNVFKAETDLSGSSIKQNDVELF